VITGVVSADYEAIIRLEVQGPTGQEREVDAVVDGLQWLSHIAATSRQPLGLTCRRRGRAILANGSEDIFDIYGVTVLWDGQPRYIETGAVDTTPLVGMALLAGYDLPIGGHIAIETPR
jgi:hypothetical protein